MKRAAFLFAAALVVATAGCARKAENSQQVNAEFRVDTLFTKDGCTVYRFYDIGNYRYFTNCAGVTTWTEGCGKNCKREMTVTGGAGASN